MGVVAPILSTPRPQSMQYIDSLSIRDSLQPRRAAPRRRIVLSTTREPKTLSRVPTLPNTTVAIGNGTSAGRPTNFRGLVTAEIAEIGDVDLTQIGSQDSSSQSQNADL